MPGKPTNQAWRAAITIALALALAPSTAQAACEQPGELAQAGEAILAKNRCILEAKPGDQENCAEIAIPACADELQGIAEDLIFSGSLPLSRSRSVARCQRTKARSLARFLARRTREVAAGVRTARAARGVARRIVGSCAGLRLQDADPKSLPTEFAGDCQVRTGSRLDAQRTAHCLRATLERAIQEASPTPQPPNVILIITDDQRHDTLDAMPETLDRLASRGTSFRNAFSTHPICGPARATILTGLDSPQHGVYSNGHGFAMDHGLALGPRLSDAGYRTGLFGKYIHAASSTDQPPAGWDDWHELHDAAAVFYGFSLNQNGTLRNFSGDLYATDVLARLLVGFVRNNIAEPFLAVFAPGAPHAPATPAQRPEGAFAGIAPHRPGNFRETATHLKPGWVNLLRSIAEAGGSPVAELDAFREMQLESLLAVDEAIARIDETLERAGVADNTVVIFTSDQGIHWGEHWSHHKFSAYEESIRVPLLIRYPNEAPRGTQRDALVAHTDLVPTILDFAGIETADTLDGTSLREAIRTGDHDREIIAMESSGGIITPRSRSLRTDRWKWIETLRNRDSRIVWRELYDLEADPGELRNLANRPAYRTLRENLSAQLEALVPLPPPRG